MVNIITNLALVQQAQYGIQYFFKLCLTQIKELLTF